MKRKYILVLFLLLTGCSQGIIEPSSSVAINDSTISDAPTSGDLDSSPVILSDSSSLTPSEPSTSLDHPSTPVIIDSSLDDDSSSSGGGNVCQTNPGGENPDGTTRMAIPCNKGSKVAIAPSSNGNVNPAVFDFSEELPDGFRHIYGNNFTNPNFYAISKGGGVRFDQVRKGIQTPMFTTNRKLEIRLHLGSINNNSHGNDIDKSIPVINVHAFDENGTLLRTTGIDEITVSSANTYKRVYLDGTDVAYLEFRLLQFAYKGSQAYNIAITGLTLIAWIYDL